MRDSSATLPTFACVLTSKAISVLSDPLHFMYVKLNEFLMRGVSWDLDKLPSYWIERIVLSPSEDNGTYWREVDWLLDVLFKGLKTTEVSE